VKRVKKRPPMPRRVRDAIAKIERVVRRAQSRTFITTVIRWTLEDWKT